MRLRPSVAGGNGKITAFEKALPPGLRQRLERERLELRALFRAADRLLVGQQLSDELHQLFELDADFAEVLHLMDLAPRDVDIKSMLRDTETSFQHVPSTRAQFLATLPTSDRKRLEAHALTVRPTLALGDAYIDIPGRDPNAAL